MGTFSIWHWLIVLAVVLVLFGGSGKISNLMGDVAKGIKSFKKGMAEDDDTDDTAKTIEHDDGKTIDAVDTTKQKAKAKG